MGYLKYIELDNFKSYKGSVKIGPFRAFTAIIGPNGSGKSNLMDAISFVLGESTKNLRVKKLSDLIHGAPIGKPVAARASVSFVYSHGNPYSRKSTQNGDDDNSSNSGDSEADANDGSPEVKFTRIVAGSSSEYRIDGAHVNATDYQTELEKIGINLKAKNFLVYQGQVESIAVKSPKEITQVIEEISHSIDLKDEYDRLKLEMDKAELETQSNFQKKRGVAAQKKEARLEKEEAERYQKLRNEMHDQELQLRLFQLFYNEKAIESIKSEHGKREKELRSLEGKREQVEDEIREMKKQQGQEAREFARIEDSIKDIEQKHLAKKKPHFIKVKETSTHLVRKLEASKASYEAAQKAHDAHLAELKSLEQELEKLANEREAFEREIEKESQSQGVSPELRDSQMRTYQALREEASSKTTNLQETLSTAQREQKSCQDSLDNEQRKKNDAQLKIKQKQSELDEQRAKLTKLIEYIGATELEIGKQREQEKKMQTEIEKAKEACKELDNELAKVMNEIGDARVDKFESSRAQKKQEVIEQLKRKFAGSVLGRLIDHCEPVHRKYQLAITKVMGKSMDAIVVDTEKTARECIQFMKEQHLPAETFYPLDYIDAGHLDERLREIRDPKNTKMLIDVIKFNPPHIKKALLFAVGNCLVCDNDDDARKLAFGSTERHKVVSLDGTLFQRSGVVSGGSTELKQKAKRWDEKHFDTLRKRKDELTENMKEQLRVRRKEPELLDLKSNIKGLEARLKYSQTNRDQIEKKGISTLEKEINELQKETSQYDPKIKTLEKHIQEHATKLKQVRTDINKIEDGIFRDFCRDIGVNNIRVYEESELASQQERVKERLVFEERKTRLTTQYQFEKSRDTLKSFMRWQVDMNAHQKQLQQLRIEEDALMLEIRKWEDQIEKKKADLEKYRHKATEFENELNEVKKRLSVQNKEINDHRKKITSIEARQLDKKLERHAILKNSKIEVIELPMLAGSMDDISEEEPTQTQPSAAADSDTLNTASTSDQNVMFEREARIRLDYRQLGRDLTSLTAGGDEVDQTETKILARLTELRELLHAFQGAPNHKVDEKLDTVTEMWESTTAEFDKARLLAKKARNAFTKVKQERYERFNSCFEHISSRIDDIYKALCMNPGAQASLVLENAEEPYSDGIIYNCVAPGKRYRQMDNLSGGEKTVAALGLLFAIRSYNPSPFFVLDEIDAALDNTNISKVANYIVEQSRKGLQCIVISLKEEFFHHSDALIGVYPIADDCIWSKMLSIDLTAYSEE